MSPSVTTVRGEFFHCFPLCLFLPSPSGFKTLNNFLKDIQVAERELEQGLSDSGARALDHCSVSASVTAASGAEDKEHAKGGSVW